MRLDELSIGKDAIIEKVNCSDRALRKHILDMGLTPGTEITLSKTAPLGDPLELRVRGYELTLRKSDAAYIDIHGIHDTHDTAVPKSRLKSVEHPRMGELDLSKKYHVRREGAALRDNEIITFGLAGNQNCGKTTLFNQLTGSNQHVGNFPGVTVDRKDGAIRGIANTNVTDLPGIYSLSPYTSEEIVTREFLLEDRPRGLINIIDATNIERNLYLTLQLIELNIPMVLALNMMDEVRENGGTIMINQLETLLGIPVVPISAAKNEGINELIDHALHVAKHRERPGRVDFCDEDGIGNGAVHRCIHAIIHLIEDHAKASGIPVRFAATKLVECDESILKRLGLDDNEKDTLEHIISQMEEESGMDREAALADMRFRFIEKLCDATVVKPHESKEHLRSKRIDKVLTGRFTAIPAFLIIMALIFYLTFGPIGSFLSGLLSKGIDSLTTFVDYALTEYGINPVVHSLIIDGIFAGVGSVLNFLPVIIVLFFFLSILEDSGYMARIAFVMDKLLRKIGLSGRSFVPMLIGFGCSVPAIMSTRTLPSDRDRKMTIFLTPFMSCSAKLPIYALFTAAFFPGKMALIIVALYSTGIVIAIAYALILKRFRRFKGEPVPFVMELPNYRMPSPKSVLQLIADKAKDFINKAFTIIFLASIIIWFLQSFDSRLNVVTDSQNSLLSMIGTLITPLFAPLGFGDWKVATSLITGFVAKESVVSTLTVLLGGNVSSLSGLFTPLTATVFLVFSLLYTPCVAAIAAIKRELGTKSAILVCIMQCVIAWLAAFMVHLIGTAIGFFFV
ncbi:MAG: ferrous iron transport protein B [Lachnospiraceae bacterium]|nr:ferrous iron transport protein B [Candidatus Colinaster equi]